LKFSPPSSRVALQVKSTPGEVQLRVVDAGPGIPAHEREHVFEPFVHGTDGARGSGLGLAIARGFVVLNRGRVWVEPDTGGGSAFVVALPTTAIAAHVRV
jgi:two-component system sensor histidine kinase KdpD